MIKVAIGFTFSLSLGKKLFNSIILTFILSLTPSKHTVDTEMGSLRESNLSQCVEDKSNKHYKNMRKTNTASK